MARGRKRKDAPKHDEKLKEKVEDETQEEMVDAEQEIVEEAPPKKAVSKGKRAKISKQDEKLKEKVEDEMQIEEAQEADAKLGKEDAPPKKAARTGKCARTSKQDVKLKEKVDDETQEEEVDAEKEKEDAPPKKATRKGKRAMISKPAEDEYFEDKRNLEDLWKEVFPVGTEWDKLDGVYQYNWSFKNLEDAFEDKGGVLHGKRVYLFVCTEPQMVQFKDVLKIILVPVVVAVVSPFPPSDKIGIKSIQRETEEIIPMKRMKMDWVPYIPLENRERQVERLKSEIYILSCNQRRKALIHLKEERLNKFQYCLPYFYNPFLEDEEEQSTVINICCPIDPNPVVCEFDWELDELEEITDNLIQGEELPADQKDVFKNHVREEVRKQKKANREAREARKKAREDLGEEMKAALESIKVYKFYPVSTPDSPDVSDVKERYINRYYGKAHEIL